MKKIAFFNNKGGVGKTSLVYHLAWMFADLGVSVVAVDFDPQANLSTMFLDDDQLADLWDGNVGDRNNTIQDAMRPLIEGVGDIAEPRALDIAPDLGLVVGDLALSVSEDELSGQWSDCLDRKPRAFRVITAFFRLMEMAARARNADLVLMDVGPSLGALNRAALIGAEHVVIPLAPDLYSLRGLENIGPTMTRWRNEWEERYDRNPVRDLSIPTGKLASLGYIVMQHAVRLDRPVKTYAKWMERIPRVYNGTVLDKSVYPSSIEDDPACLAAVKHYRSLMPLAQEARKPMFQLKPADGAVGAHINAVRDCYDDFRHLAIEIAKRSELQLPPTH